MANASQVKKAVIPAAGLGTRFLPVTKASAKEMLPVVDVPAIQYVVQEAADAGLDDVLLVTGRGKTAIEDHFDRAPLLEESLEAKGDTARAELVRQSSEIATIHSVRQGKPLGLGHAVLCAREHVGDNTFAVLLGDDLIDPRDAILPKMVEVATQTGGSVIALMEVAPEHVHMYGCAAVEPTTQDDVVKVNELVEKPPPGEQPSNYIVIGRYVINPAVFAVLAKTPPGRGNEIQLTDALQQLAAMSPSEGGGVYGVVFSGRRYDTGDKQSYLQANIRLACEREDLGPELRGWLKDYVASEEFHKL